ncbi:hypothetical protein [Amycolatopsis palatopharyngis]|uniref:hypothetical protein n=1 Tax=Amycolatopsis palatopharyngis TaxID=187982 RepID=UPI000E279A47|nr:hypothetical protein [Amycolatopsis palatopharyngis]
MSWTPQTAPARGAESAGPATDPVRGVSDRRLAAVVGLVSALVFVVLRPHLIDDTYITLSYAKNLALHGHWGLITEGTSNTATSPLNVLALAVLTVVLREAEVAVGVLFVLTQVLLVLGLRRIGERQGLPSWFAPVTVAVLTLNPLLISSVGLEIGLGAAALAWLLVFAAERRPLALGAVAGLVALIRLDLLVLVAVVVLARRGAFAGALRTVAGFLGVALPWFLFSWLALGSAVPDTLVIKTLQRSWGEWSFTNGAALYWQHFPLETVLSFLPLLLAAVAGPIWLVRLLHGSVADRELVPFAALAVGGALHFLAYVWLDVPPYHWYYGPSIIAATVFLLAWGARLRARVGIAAGLVLATVSALAYAAPGLPRDFSPITSNHATSERYSEIGQDLGRIAQGRTVHSAGEIGALAYSCDCAIVDLFSDRGAVAPAIEESERRSGTVGRALTEANFQFFDRNQRPVAPELVLEVTTGVPPAKALATWTIHSPWAGTQQLYLVNAADARPPKRMW